MALGKKSASLAAARRPVDRHIWRSNNRCMNSASNLIPRAKARAEKPAWAFCLFSLPRQTTATLAIHRIFIKQFLCSAEPRASAFVVRAGMQTLEEEFHD